jgi:arginine-tRNA-protein transferase
VRILERFVTFPQACPYLAGLEARFEFSIASRLTPEEYEDLMNRGYRKFGAQFFKPICDACQACRPIRVPVAAFAPDRSQRRALKSNADLEVRLGVPTVDDARLELYNRYHDAQAARKGWPEQAKDAAEYKDSFVRNPIPSVEITLWEKDALRAVILTEITPHVVSAIYHYHDRDFPKRALGTTCILQTIELARKLGKPWVYLGYYVRGSASMEYKSRFRPCEVLGTDGVWQAFDPRA